MENKTLQELIKFFYTVKRMRKAQKDYFKTRHYSHLDKAKRLEREVDKILKELDPRQNNIFDI